jgi:hypothetical protein
MEFTDLFVRAYQTKEQRLLWDGIVNEVAAEANGSLYEPTVLEFGVQETLQMLVYAGVESVALGQFETALSKNHDRRKLILGDLKSAIAIDINSNALEYEVIYIEVFDNLETDGVSVAPLITTPDNSELYPPSITNMRRRIRDMGVGRRRSDLPLWMRTIQPGDAVQPGYTKAIPLCYVAPGTANEILLRLRAKNLAIKDIDFDFDRYVIGSLNGVAGEQFLLFPSNL